MAESLPTSLEKLRKSAAALNKITDQAAATVKEVEDFLNKQCSVGVHAFVKVSENENEHYTSTQYLEYRRVGQKYRIAVVWNNDMEPERENVKPWSDSSRDDKLETIAKLPDLINQIAEKLDQKLAEAQKTLGTVTEVFRAMTGKEGA